MVWTGSAYLSLTCSFDGAHWCHKVIQNVTHIVQPTPTLHKSTAMHLISSSAIFLDAHSEWRCDLLPAMTSWIFFPKCCVLECDDYISRHNAC
jgi:hypothetical protein